MNNENELRNFIKNSIKSDMHLVDIPDEGKKIVKILPQHAELIVNCIEEKVYDLGIGYKGQYAGIELKNVNQGLVFNTNRLAPHQKINLLQCVKCGFLGYVIVRFKKGLTQKERLRLNTKSYAIDKTFAIGIQWLDEQKEESLPIELLQEHCLEIPFCEFSKTYSLETLWKKIS